MIVAIALTVLTFVDFIALMWGLYTISKLEKNFGERNS